MNFFACEIDLFFAEIDFCEQNCVWLFHCFNFERNYDVLESMLFVKQFINFNKNETVSKMENSTGTLREMNLAVNIT